MRRLHIWISGRVQGIGYRAFVREEAQQRSLSGWVRNLDDGRVEMVVEGPDQPLQALLQQLRKGPAGARVDRVITEDERPKGESRQFQITD